MQLCSAERGEQQGQSSQKQNSSGMDGSAGQPSLLLSPRLRRSLMHLPANRAPCTSQAGRAGRQTGRTAVGLPQRKQQQRRPHHCPHRVYQRVGPARGRLPCAELNTALGCALLLHAPLHWSDLPAVLLPSC
jgi:hypothetical protein